MNKINNFNNLIKAALLCLLVISGQTKVFCKKLKSDDIKPGHALLHSRWIANMYQYGPGKPHRQVVTRRNRVRLVVEEGQDAVANLIRKFWFRISEQDQLLPTKYGCLANIPNDQLGRIFGKLINCVCQGFQEKQQEVLVDELLQYDPEYMQFRQELTALLRELIDEGYKLKHQKFNLIKQAKKKEQEEIEYLKGEYKITEFNQKIAQASKKWGKRRGFAKEKKRTEREMGFDRAGYIKALKVIKQKFTGSVDKGIQDEYRFIEMAVKKMKATIEKKVRKKRDTIKKPLIMPIEAALEFCKTGDRYAPRTTETILWALFLDKLEGLNSSEEKIRAINDCFNAIGEEFKCAGFCSKELLMEFGYRCEFDEQEVEFVDVTREKPVDCIGSSTTLEFLKDKKSHWGLPMLNLCYYFLDMRSPEVKLVIIEDVLERGYYDAFKEMIHNLIEAIPLSDPHLNREVAKIIISSGFYEKDVFLKRFMQDSLDRPSFYDNKEGIIEILVLALDMGTKEVVEKILKSEHFPKNPEADQDLDSSSQENVNSPCGIVYVITQLRKRGYTELADEIEKNTAFGVDVKWVSHSLRYSKNETPDRSERAKLLNDEVCLAKQQDNVLGQAQDDQGEEVESVIEEDQVCMIQLFNKKLYLNKSFLLL